MPGICKQSAKLCAWLGTWWFLNTSGPWQEQFRVWIKLVVIVEQGGHTSEDIPSKVILSQASGSPTLTALAGLSKLHTALRQPRRLFNDNSHATPSWGHILSHLGEETELYRSCKALAHDLSPTGGKKLFNTRPIQARHSIHVFSNFKLTSSGKTQAWGKLRPKSTKNPKYYLQMKSDQECKRSCRSKDSIDRHQAPRWIN